MTQKELVEGDWRPSEALHIAETLFKLPKAMGLVDVAVALQVGDDRVLWKEFLHVVVEKVSRVPPGETVRTAVIAEEVRNTFRMYFGADGSNGELASRRDEMHHQVGLKLGGEKQDELLLDVGRAVDPVTVSRNETSDALEEVRGLIGEATRRFGQKDQWWIEVEQLYVNLRVQYENWRAKPDPNDQLAMKEISEILESFRTNISNKEKTGWADRAEERWMDLRKKLEEMKPKK